MGANNLDARNWDQAIRKLGKKATPQRKAILTALSQQDKPATVDEIFIEVREHQKTSLSTVYRNLELLFSQGLINKQGFPGEKARYSLKRDTHEHTLVCIDCRKIVAITGCPLESYAVEIGLRENFVVLDHRMEMYGYCQKCSQIRGRVSD
jgi:Fur family ferric uptake transcriptional regulator